MWCGGTASSTSRASASRGRRGFPSGRSLVLSDVAFGSRRAPEGRLRWQLAPAAVVVSCADMRRRYELAVLPASVKYLYWSQVAAA